MFRNKKQKLYDTGLPTNRFQQLGNSLRHHLWEIMLASLAIFLFMIPLLGWIFLTTYVPMFKQNNVWVILLVDGVNAILLGIVGLGYAGAMRFFRKLSFGEGASLRADAIDGIKKSGKTFFFAFLSNGIWYLFLHLSLAIVQGMEMPVWSKIMVMGVGYALFFLVSFVHIFLLSEATNFEGGYLSLLRSSFRLSMASLYKGIWVYLVFLLPLIVYEFVPGTVLRLIGVMIGAFFVFGFSCLLLCLFCNHVYDHSVFKTQYPEMYRKGLAKEHQDNLY